MNQDSPQFNPAPSGDQPTSTPPVIPPNAPKSHKALIIASIVLVVLIGAGAAFSLYQSRQAVTEPAPQAAQNDIQPEDPGLKIISPTDNTKIDPYADFNLRWQVNVALSNDIVQIFVKGAGQQLTCRPGF
jgi:hypothetical protein